MKAFSLFLGAALVIVVVAGLLLGLAFPTAADHRAIWISAAVALVVQGFAFLIVRLAAGMRVMAGWGIGAVLRLVVLVAYAFLATGALGLPATAALISLVVFFFLSTLIEPLLLRL